jgi:biofilm PGA synthesis N-glycosyltransferase PgaC
MAAVTSGNKEPGLYLLLTAAYNEAAFIEETIKSVVAQSVLPSIWVIVSDGSTDGTEEIVHRYSARHSFIRLLRRDRDQVRHFASKVLALRAGFRSISVVSIPFISHLDADVALPSHYYRELLRQFDDDPSLGIAGGWCVERVGDERRFVGGSNPASVPGSLQTFRRECYEDIGELLPIEYGGEDWYAEIMARKCGWRVRSFPELAAHHLRQTGSRGGSPLHYCYRQGFMDFSLGSHPIFELAKVARRISWQPYCFGALARLMGFGVAHLCGKRMVPPDFVAFLRREQVSRLHFSSLLGARIRRT